MATLLVVAMGFGMFFQEETLPGPSIADETGSAKVTYVLAAVQAREARDPVRLYARFEVEDDLPGMTTPSGRPYGGKIHSREHQITYEDWWIEGDKLSVAVLGDSRLWLDGELAFEESSGYRAKYFHTFDGTQSFTFNETAGESTLVIGSGFPFAGSVYPVLFGRAKSDKRLSELLDTRTGHDVKFIGTEPGTNGQLWVLQVVCQDKSSLTLWLAEDMDFCWTRIETRLANGELGSVHTAQLGRSEDGLVYPLEGAEEFHLPRGISTKHWRTLAFAKDPPLPPHGFSPSSSDFQKVRTQSLATVVSR